MVTGRALQKGARTSVPHSRLTQRQERDTVTPSAVTSVLLYRMCIHSSNTWFLSPSHVPGTLSKTGSDTRASLTSRWVLVE